MRDLNEEGALKSLTLILLIMSVGNSFPEFGDVINIYTISFIMVIYLPNVIVLAKDTWTSKETSLTSKFPEIFHYDKLQHFGLGMLLAVFFETDTSMYCALGWELKDGILSYTKGWTIFGYNVGGDGFSMRDLVSTILGITIITLIQGVL